MQEKDIMDYFAPVNTVLIVINIIVFLFIDLTYSSSNWDWLLQCGALYSPYAVEGKEYYRFLTSLFLHSGISHLANNMLMLWFIGGTLEPIIGKVRYILLYFGSGILAGIISVSYNVFIDNVVISVGASGAVFGVVGGLVYIVIRSRGTTHSSEVNLSPRQMILFVILSLCSGLANEGVGNVAHFGGFVSGILLAIFLNKKIFNDGRIFK